MQNARVPIERCLLVLYYRLWYLWKAERIRNISISKDLKKSKKRKRKKSLTVWVATRGYDGCNRFLSGTDLLHAH